MIIRTIQIHCDGQGCDECMESDTHLAKQAQRIANQRGWTVSVTRGHKYHYCPKCTVLNSLNGISEKPI